MTKLHKNVFWYILYGIVSVIIIYVMAYLSRYCSFHADDFWYARIHENEKCFDTLNFFITGHGCGYIGWTICKLLCFKIPILLNINPADFINIPVGIIRGIFNVIIFYIILLYFKIFCKSKVINLVLFISLAIYFLYNAIFPSLVIAVNYNYCRYFGSLFFFGIFWLYIYKHLIVKYKKINYWYFAGIILCGYTLGCSIEIEIFTSVFLSFLLVCYNIIILLISKLLKSDFNYLKYNLDKNFWIPVIVLFVGMGFYTTSRGFIEVATDRGMSDINITKAIVTEFLHQYFEFCFTNVIYYWIVFIILAALALYFAYKRNEQKKVIFPLLMQFSILTVIYSLILCGKTYHDGSCFFLRHENIIFLYSMLILYPLLMLLGYIIKKLEYILKNKIIFINLIKMVVILIVLIPSVFFCINIPRKVSWHINISKNAYISNYIVEKMIRFYYLIGKTPVLPQNRVKRNIEELLMQDHIPVYLNSLALIYHDENYRDITFEISNDSMIQFENAGGVFTQKELDNISFERLKDDDFVLNKKILNTECKIGKADLLFSFFNK